MPSHHVEAVEIFCSYAHKDESLREQLETHLSSLIREKKIKHWHDRMIKPGENWKGKIDKHLERAHIVLLLISADFIKSDYCHEIEMQRAMQRYRAGEARVIPIILRPCDWETSPFGELQALPKGAVPVTEWPRDDAAFTSIAKGIRLIVDELLGATLGGPSLPRVPASISLRSSIPRPPVFGFVARRDAEGRDIVARLKEELAPGKNKLVTLSGPGGIGKTTLAAEGARTLEAEFGSRVIWSSAEKRTDFTLSILLDDIATQTGHADLRTLAPEAKEAAVRALVADPPTIVVLDNCETMALAEQKRIEEWLAPAQCSALFTSRPGISVTLNIRVAAMSREEAEEFLQKLVAQTQDAEIFSDEIRQRIYQTAEANPFVMQWIVAQIDAAQEPRTVLEELAGGKGDAAQRVFDRSFNLPRLGDDGRDTLLALALFIPSASRRALAEVAGFGNDEGRVNEAIKILRALWLIKGIDENSRLTIEGLTRSLTGARLSGDTRADEFRQRFVTYFRSYAEGYAQPTPEDFNALEAERDNLLSAVDMAFSLTDWLDVIQLVDVLAHINGFLHVRGYWKEVLKCNSQGIEAANVTKNEHTATVFSQRIGNLQYAQGLYAEARRSNELALTTYRSLNSERNIAASLHLLAMLAQEQGELEEARRLYGESLDIAKRLGDQNGIAITLHELGRLAQEQGELEEARRLYGESLDIAKRLGDQSGIASTTSQIGIILFEQAELAESKAKHEESLAIRRTLGEQQGIAIDLHQLAILAQEQGELEEARRLYGESLDIKKRLGDQSGIAITLHELGRLARGQGELEEARRLYGESLDIFERLKSPNAEITRRNLARLEGEDS